MKKVIYLFGLFILSGMIFMSCTNASKKTSESEAATEVAPAEEEWISLFNGEDFTGWRGYNRADMPAAWTIEDRSWENQYPNCLRRSASEAWRPRAR